MWAHNIRQFLSVARFHLVVLLNIIFCLIRNIKWYFDGTYAEIHKNQGDPSNYARSAHRKNVLIPYKLDILALVGTRNFFMTHEDFVHPDYVLKDEVTLLQMTDKEAIFVERAPEFQPAHCSVYSFFIIGQFRSASKIITMPLDSFNRLAESMERDDGKIVFLHNQSRCGSSLLTSVFESTGRCIAINEPQALNAVCYYIYSLKKWDPQTSKRMLKSCILMLSKPYRSLSGGTMAYIIKPTATSEICLDMLDELFPDAVHIFMYRSPIPVAQSLRRLMEAVESLWVIRFLLVLKIPNLIATIFHHFMLVNDLYKGWTPTTTTGLEFGYKIAMNAVHYYRYFSKKGIDIKGLRYEDLRDQPESMIKQAFALAGIPESMVPLGLKAMKVDSQGASQINMGRMRALLPVVPQPTPEFLAAVREENKHLDIVDHDCWNDKDFRLSGSIIP